MSATISFPRSMYEALRRKAGKAVARQYMRDLHPQQAAFVADPSKRKAALCGRRAGKTHGIGAWLLDGAEQKPHAKSLYIALTRAKAKSVLWDDCVADLNRRYRLGLTLKNDNGMLYIVHPNGHRIWLLGVDDQSEVDKVRGEKLWRVVVDEAQAFGDHMAELVEEAVEWALMDLQGQIALTGTPGPVCMGYFWAATTGGDPNFAKWPTHHWTVRDNKAMPHADEWLEERRKLNGWKDESHPTYRRECLGEWTDDLGALIYPFTYKGNGYEPNGPAPFGLPPGDYVYGLAVDIGFSERSTAFTLAALRRGTGQVYLVRSYTRSRLIPTALAAHCQALREEVHRVTGQGLQIVVDEGALGKGFAAQMRDMGVGCEAAEKSEKRAYQEYVGGLIRSSSPPYRNDLTNEWEGGFGVLVDFHACSELVEEARKLQFDEETGKEDERYRRHCCDSALYIVRRLMPRYDPELNPPKPGSREAVEAEMRALRQKHIDDRDKKRRRV